ncbi:helix-turn-helix domain-containing protein [Aquimarina gracilis]|uniref:Helix-turn-helix domain-containing protein n=1 Tax=Aquimarina gracilis TaxID=874422 RepID=A0ABU5ZSR8_9FLAO|nr:helix-turn-helix domain-containing protein [Aquimarina gracilis]MEB3345116.1 helix-turn-helix domain-containing protein [Aquimarina gracilis]
MKKKYTTQVPRLNLDELVSNIKGQAYIQQKLKFLGGLNGIYVDTLSNLENSVPKLPKSYVQDFYSIYALQSGTISKINQTQHVNFKNDAIYVSVPGQMKHWQFAENVEGYFIAFSKDYLRSLKYRKNMLVEFPFLAPKTNIETNLPTEELDKLTRLLHKAHFQFETKDKLSYELIQLWVMEILLLIKRAYINTPSGLQDISKSGAEVANNFLERLESHFIQGIKHNYVSSKGVNKFAEEMHIQYKVLSNHIKKYTGKSPKAIIAERYLLAAKCKLIHTDISVSEIGYILGFDNPSYFSRFFKKGTGISPQAYREDFEKNMLAPI